MPAPKNANSQPSNPNWKLIPPRPNIVVKKKESDVVIEWDMTEMNDKHAQVAKYEIFAYQEKLAAPSSESWSFVGDTPAMPLPMAATLKFQEGARYHFALRAVDEHKRFGVFTLPKTWADSSTENDSEVTTS